MGDWPNPDLRAKLQRQAAALARAMLEGRERIVPNASRMHALLFQLGVPDDDVARSAFAAVLSETDHLPVGSERQYWDPEALAKKDQEIVRIEEWARGVALPACERLVKRFALAAASPHDDAPTEA